MSNKQQLQTNNIALDALITRVNAAKDTAASLPETGGESGGNSTININIVGDYSYFSLYYWNQEGALCKTSTFGTINALAGIIFENGSGLLTITATGNYISQNNAGDSCKTFRFLSDGGTLSIYRAGGGSDS